MKKPRKPSPKAGAEPESYPLTGQPTPEQAAELAEAFHKVTLRRVSRAVLRSSAAATREKAQAAQTARPKNPKGGRQWRVSRISAPRVLVIEPAANPLSPSDWLSVEVARRKEAGDIPVSMTVFAKQLADQMAVAVQAKKCSRALARPLIRRRLYGKKLRELLGLK